MYIVTIAEDGLRMSRDFWVKSPTKEGLKGLQDGLKRVEGVTLIQPRKSRH